VHDLNADFVIEINLIQGRDNFLRSLPFFTNSVVIKRTIDGSEKIICAVVSNSVLGFFYWSENNGKASNENRLIKSSQVSDKVVANVVSDKKMSLNLNCLPLEVCYFGAGKIDVLERDWNDFAEIEAAIVVAQNAGSGRAEFKIDREKRKVFSLLVIEICCRSLNG